MSKIILRIFLASTLGASGVMAGDCVQFFNGHQVHRAQAVVSCPHAHFNYFVGAPVRVEALVQKAMRKDPLWKEFQAFKAFTAKQEAQAPEKPPEAIAATFLKTNCGQCHSGPEPKAGLLLDGSAPIESKNVTKILAWLSGLEAPEGETMPGVIGKIKDEDKPKIMEELLSVRARD